MTKKTFFKFFMTTFTLTFALAAFSCTMQDTDTTSESDTGTKPNAASDSNTTTENNKTSTETKQTETSMNEKQTDDLHVVIYGIGIRGKEVGSGGKVTSDPNNKFAILYNQTEKDVNISSWKIKKAAFNTQNDSDSYKSTFDIPENTTIKGKQYLLLTREGYKPDVWKGDVSSDICLKGAGKLDFGTNGCHIVLVDTSDDVIDRLDYIELSTAKQKNWERKYNELYIPYKENTAYIFRTTPDTDTNIYYEDFTSKTIYDECILKNSATAAK